MRHLQIALLTLLILLGLAGPVTGGILPETFWNWGGDSLLGLLQSRINGQVAARQISGNPLTGITYQDLEVRGPTGEVLLQAPRLEVRFSLLSLASLRLEVAHLALHDPHVLLVQEKSGRWNVTDLQRETAPPEKPGGFFGYLLQELDFSHLEVARGEISLTRSGVTTHYAGLNLQAQLAIRHLGRPQQELTVKIDDFEITAPQGRLQLATSFLYRAEEISVESLQLKAGGATLLFLRGEMCQIFKNLTCKLEGEVGPLPGKQIHAVWSRWPVAWDLAGKVSLMSGADGMRLQAQGGIGQANFTLKGQWQTTAKPPVFELDLDLTGLTPAQLQELPGLKAPQVQSLSPVDARLHVQGAGNPWSPESLEARLDLTPFQWREIKVSQAQLTMRGDARSQELRGVLKGNFGAVTVGSRGQLLPLGEPGKGLAGEITLETEALQPALLGVKQYPGTLLNATFKGKFRLPPNFSLAQAYLAGVLSARGRLGQEPLKDLQSSFVLEGRKLTLSQAKIRLAGLEATLKGTLHDRGMDLSFAGAVAGSRQLPWAPPVPTFAHLKAEGTVRGTWQAPQWSILAKVSQANFAGLTLGSADLTAALSGWPPQSGHLQLQGSQGRTAAGTFARVQLRAQGEAGRWQFQLAASSPPTPRAELTGTAELTSRPLVVALERLFWQSQEVTVKNQAPFQVRFMPGWEISPATLQVDGGTVTVQAVARGQELSGALNLRDLDAGLFKTAGLPAQGKLSGHLTLSGTPAAPIIDGRLELNAGKIKDIPLRTLASTLSYQANLLQVSGYLEETTQGSRLTWKGAVPVHLSLLPPRCALGEQGLDLRVKSEKLNLSMAKSLNPEIQALEAPVDLEVEMKGNPRQPQVSGHVHWGAGTLQVRQTGIPYRLEPGDIRLQGSKIVIPGIILSSEGTIRLAGEILLAGSPRAELKAQLDNFRLMDQGGNEIWTNGVIDLGGPLSALVAKGRLMVPKGQFRPGFFRSKMEPDIVLVKSRPNEVEGGPVPVPAIYQNMGIDVALESPGSVWLKDPMGQVEMTADLRAIKKPGQEMALKGVVRALKGTLDVQERTFTVEHAKLTFPGVPRQPIAVDGKATHKMDVVTLVLTVTGSITNAQIRLESLPPLPPADVLSYLAFGAPSATLSKEQYLALGAQSLGVLGGVTPKKIDEILGSTIPFLSGIKVKSGLMGGRPTVGVAKDITKNVSVFYGRNLNEERGQYERWVGFEYKINRNFSVESQLGPRNSGADVLFNYDF